jgi:hypothetical protein
MEALKFGKWAKVSRQRKAMRFVGVANQVTSHFAMART